VLPEKLATLSRDKEILEILFYTLYYVLYGGHGKIGYVAPKGACAAASYLIKFDGNQEVLSFPGFHRIFFYGDYKRQLMELCRLFNFEAQVV
jgi:hypothetical protein